MDTLQYEVEKLLRQLTSEELQITAKDLKLELGGVEKRDLLRSIYEVFDNLTTDDEKLKTFTRLSVPTTTSKILEDLLTRYLLPKESEEAVITPDENNKEQTKSSTESNTILPTNSASIFRKVLKIAGIIGGGKESGNKELNYINLCSQINDAKRAGFTDNEIMAAVKKSISAGSNLRTYFDSRDDWSLDQMLQFLRNFFREKSPAEIFSELNTVCQGPEEEATSFLMRLFELRQKVLMASLAETLIPYEKSLVQNSFLRSIQTGLREESLRSHMKPFLNPAKKSDDATLIQELNVAAEEVAERNNKQKQQVSEKKTTFRCKCYRHDF